MKHMGRTIFTVCMLLLNSAIAENSALSKPQGFVTDIMNSKQEMEARKPEINLETESPNPMQNQESESVQIEQSISAPTVSKEKEGVIVKTIGAILSPKDKESFEKSVTTFIEAIDRYDLIAGPVYFVAPPGFIPDAEKVLYPLGLRGADVSFGTGVPEQYKVKLAPTWVVSTVKGDVILEGFQSLDQFFNRQGMFVEPEHK